MMKAGVLVGKYRWEPSGLTTCLDIARFSQLRVGTAFEDGTIGVENNICNNQMAKQN